VDSFAPKLPFYLPNETKKLVAIDEIQRLNFWSLVSSGQAESEQDRKIVVLIHGYNFNFERACKRATELQRLLGGSFSVVLFTWPSAGNPVAYSRDETNAGWSVPHLQEFLTRATTAVGPEAIALIGHSLGARTLSRALNGLAQNASDDAPFAELVLSAADIDAGVFKGLWLNIRRRVHRLTLYSSDSDAPLMASHALHGYPRLGEAGEHLTFLDGAETIDASGTGFFELTGHNYQYFHPLLLADLRELMQTGRGADAREHLKPRALNGERYWVLTPPKPDQAPAKSDEVI
jgi:esterase/lipase superfamily enzyme